MEDNDPSQQPVEARPYPAAAEDTSPAAQPAPRATWVAPDYYAPPPAPPVDEVPPGFFGPNFAHGHRMKLIAGLFLIFGGMLSLFLLAIIEQQWRDGLTWGYAMAGPVIGVPPSDSIPTRIRPVPIDNFPEQAQLALAIGQLIAMDAGDGAPPLDLDNTEALLMADIPAEDLEGMLADGRVPEPGKPEVLAGDLCRVEKFKVDAIEFTVVGHIKPGTGALTFSFVLPKHEAWMPLFEHEDTIDAWIVPDGKLNAADVLVEAGIMKEEQRGDMSAMLDVQEVLSVYEGSHLHPLTRTMPRLASMGVAIMLIMLLGATLVSTHALLLLRPKAPAYMRVLCEEVAIGTNSWFIVHVICYGVFGLLMLMGVNEPLGNMQIIEIVKQQFTEGDLAYIGRAYLSGNVLQAANATWMNNFVLQTLILSVLVSLVIPFAGLFKTLISLGIAGFAMAPVWTDIISGYILHSGTMVLELEPYVIIAWACAMWPIWIFQGLRQGQLALKLKRGFLVLAQATLIAGAALYIAALYEGLTLISVAGL